MQWSPLPFWTAWWPAFAAPSLLLSAEEALERSRKIFAKRRRVADLDVGDLPALVYNHQRGKIAHVVLLDQPVTAQHWIGPREKLF